MKLFACLNDAENSEIWGRNVNQSDFFFFSGYYVLFAVNNDIGVFFHFLIISFLFPFPFFSVKETPACQYLDSYLAS